MEAGGKVKMRGVEVGRVGGIEGGSTPVRLRLEIYPDELRLIPANVGAEIRATTAFGAKYVDLIPPDHPTADRLRAGQVIQSRNVATEVNTVFQNLTACCTTSTLRSSTPFCRRRLKVSAVKRPSIGQGITDANAVLLELNPRAETIRRDCQSSRVSATPTATPRRTSSPS